MAEKPNPMSVEEFVDWWFQNGMKYDCLVKTLESRDRAQFLAGWQAGLEAAGEHIEGRLGWKRTEYQLAAEVRSLQPPAETKQEER